MAQSKGRIVVWSIVGLVVVVVAILFLTAERGDTAPVNVRALTRNTERALGRLEEEAAELRGMVGPEADETLAEFEQHIAGARDALDEMQDETDQRKLRELREVIREHERVARELLFEL